MKIAIGSITAALATVVGVERLRTSVGSLGLDVDS